jgi:hypothetical protein
MKFSNQSIEGDLSSSQQTTVNNGIVVNRNEPVPFWPTVQADVARFREEDISLRTLVRGLLSQGFQALFVYRIFRWCY